MINGDFLVIEWVKVKIHEPESEQQTSPNSCTVTMDDFRVCQRQQSSILMKLIIFPCSIN